MKSGRGRVDDRRSTLLSAVPASSRRQRAIMTVVSSDPLWPEIDVLAQRLVPRVLQQIDTLAEQAAAIGNWTVPSGTSLAADDRATRPYQASHAIQACLIAGIDNLNGLRYMMFGPPDVKNRDVTIHQAAHYLLARGAIENFATGLWMIMPKSRPERLTRTMRWHAQNIRDMHSALDPLPVEATFTTREEKLEALETVLISATGGVPPRFRHGYTATEVVRFADTVSPTESKLLSTESIWRLCSGFAHGRPWANLGFLAREELPTNDPDILHARLTSDLPRALMAPQHALKLCTALLSAYNRRSTSH